MTDLEISLGWIGRTKKPMPSPAAIAEIDAEPLALFSPPVCAETSATTPAPALAAFPPSALTATNARPIASRATPFFPCAEAEALADTAAWPVRSSGASSATPYAAVSADAPTDALPDADFLPAAPGDMLAMEETATRMAFLPVATEPAVTACAPEPETPFFPDAARDAAADSEAAPETAFLPVADKEALATWAAMPRPVFTPVAAHDAEAETAAVPEIDPDHASTKSPMSNSPASSPQIDDAPLTLPFRKSRGRSCCGNWTAINYP